jgi:hypothetical protein
MMFQNEDLATAVLNANANGFGSPTGCDTGGTASKVDNSDVTWPLMDEAAYHGLAGQIVKTIDPHTEADPVAILIQFLAYFGNMVGKTPYYQVEADHHHTNLFAVLVGASSKARKGTSAGQVRSIVKAADEQWIEERMKGGLSSGEGLINEVRDQIERHNSAGEIEIVASGMKDKRLMVTEPEFGNALAVMERPGNTLSATIRNAWDGHTLSTMTKNSSLKATGAHVSIVGHITEDELRSRLNRTEVANGFANRFLFVLIRRSKLLPHGGNLGEVAEAKDVQRKIETAVEFAKQVGRVEMTEEARQYWAQIYPELSEGRPGLLGAVTGRAEAQTIRLALIYALLDCGDEIDVVHLRAALAVWEYCEASGARIFGKALGDPIADEILQALQSVGAVGKNRTALRDLFSRHKSAGRISSALALLESRGRATCKFVPTEGRSIEIWFATKEA